MSMQVGQSRGITQTTKVEQKESKASPAQTLATKESVNILKAICENLKSQGSEGPPTAEPIVVEGQIAEPNQDLPIAEAVVVDTEASLANVEISTSSKKGIMENLTTTKNESKNTETRSLTFFEKATKAKNIAKNFLGISQISNKVSEFKKNTCNFISKSMGNSKTAQAVKFLGKGVGTLISLVPTAIKTISYGHFSDTKAAVQKAARADVLMNMVPAKNDAPGGYDKLNEVKTETVNTINDKNAELENILNGVEGSTPEEQLDNLKSMANNDESGDAIKAFNDAIALQKEIETLDAELELIDTLSDKNLDYGQKTQLVADINLDASAAVGNSMWSAGFTASFVFPPAAGLAALGGTVFLAAKAVKATNNLIRTVRSGAKAHNLANSVKDTSTKLQEAAGKLGETGSKIVDTLQNKSLSEAEKKEEIKTLVDQSMKSDEGLAEIKDTLEEIGKLAEELESLEGEIESNKKDAWDAAITGLWDVVNIGTWSVGIYAAGGGAEAAFGTDGAGFEAGIEAAWEHMSDPNNILTQVSDAPNFAESLISGEGFQAQTSGMADWATEAFLFKLEANIQSGEYGTAEENVSKLKEFITGGDNIEKLETLENQLNEIKSQQ